MPVSRTGPALSELRGVLRAIDRTLKPTILEQMAAAALKLTLECFKRTRDPEGKRWAPYKGTSKRRGLLVKSGALRAGNKAYVRGTSAGVDSTDWKSPFHLNPLKRTTRVTHYKKVRRTKTIINDKVLGFSVRRSRVVKVVASRTGVQTNTVRPARRWIPQAGRLPPDWKAKLAAVAAAATKQVARRVLGRF